MPRETGRSSVYELRPILHVPLRYAYRWLTDYRPEDSRYAREHYRRRILSRAPRRVVLEDVEDAPGGGWTWRRTVVRLYPPDRWHAFSVGNYRTFDIDYRLRALGREVTELTFRGTRTPTPLARPPPRRAAVLEDLTRLWRNLGGALERDYRASARRASTK